MTTRKAIKDAIWAEAQRRPRVDGKVHPFFKIDWSFKVVDGKVVPFEVEETFPINGKGPLPVDQPHFHVHIEFDCDNRATMLRQWNARIEEELDRIMGELNVK
jgi:hypothetical protein